MAMMDEACLNVGNTTDKQLLDAMDSQLAQAVDSLVPIGRGQRNALTQTRRASLTRAGLAHFRGGHAAAEG